MASPGEGRAWTPRDHDRRQLHRICGMGAPASMLCTRTASIPATAVDRRARKGGVGLCRRPVHSATSRRCRRCWCSGVVMGGRLQQPCRRRPSMPPGPLSAAVTRAEKKGETALGRRLGAGVGVGATCISSLSKWPAKSVSELNISRIGRAVWKHGQSVSGTYRPDCRVRDANPIH